MKFVEYDTCTGEKKCLSFYVDSKGRSDTELFCEVVSWRGRAPHARVVYRVVHEIRPTGQGFSNMYGTDYCEWEGVVVYQGQRRRVTIWAERKSGSTHYPHRWSEDTI